MSLEIRREVISKQLAARYNEGIRAREVRLIGSDRQQIGVVSLAKALAIARSEGLDLMEISPGERPPVCIVVDRGKYLFSQQQRQKQQRDKQKHVQSKEVKFRPNTDDGDFQRKVKNINDFLLEGRKVKISLRYRGRELQHVNVGMAVMSRVKAALIEGATIEQDAQMEGRQALMVVSLSEKERKKWGEQNAKNED